MERADDSTLQQRPEGFNVVRVDITPNIGLVVVPDKFMGVSGIEFAVGGMLVRREKRHVRAYGRLDELVKSLATSVLNRLTHDVAFARDGPDYRHLAGSFPARLVRSL